MWTLCVIVDDFKDFEELLRENILDKNFLLGYPKQLFPYLRRLFLAKETATCCFLDDVYVHTSRVYPSGENITFHIEDITDELVNRNFDESTKEFYEETIHS